MFRAFCFLKTAKDHAIRLTSMPVATYKQASELLDEMSKLISPTSIVTGGDLERKVEGIGWTLCDHADYAEES